MKKFIAILIALILAFGCGFYGGILFEQNQGDHYDSKTIEEKVLEISELASLECDYTDEGKYTGDPKKLFGHNIPFTSKEMRIQYSGTVKMGPKLKDNMTVDVDDETEKVTVTIPHSEILSHEIDEESIEIVYIRNGVFNSVKPDNVNEVRKDTKAKKEKSIKKSDYLDQADEYAVKQITDFLKSVYPEIDVEVVVK